MASFAKHPLNAHIIAFIVLGGRFWVEFLNLLLLSFGLYSFQSPEEALLSFSIASLETSL
jgi:hypothetical protein